MRFSDQGFWTQVLMVVAFFAAMIAIYFVVHFVMRSLPWQLVGIATLTLVAFLVGWDYGERSASRKNAVTHPRGDSRSSQSRRR